MNEVLSDAPLPVPAPVPNPDTEEFWAATREGRLLIRRCRTCGEAIWYPRPMCPFCYSGDTAWETASGRGRIYSYSVVHRARGDWAGATPYVLAYVELDEGPRLMTNIVDCDVAAVAIDDPVEVVFHDSGEGGALPRFRPVERG